MRNIITPPQTPGQWLLSSVGWTANCLLGAWLVNQLAYSRFWSSSGAGAYDIKAAAVLALSSSCVAHGLIWWLALSGSSTVIRQAKKRGSFSWLTLMAEVWQGVLSCFQLICIGLLVLLLLVTLIIVSDVDIAPHFG
jgi:hypothetical protein